MAHAAIAANITVDDFYPEEHTGRQIVYSGEPWNVGQNCHNCTARPDKDVAFKHSWHDTTYDTLKSPGESSGTAAFNFTGAVR